MLISIIIPVYNSEKYLCQCINNILQQTYLELEIILVDDGSTDSSPKLCDDFSKKDNRIVVIHKKNGGTSSARNAGIAAARGEYITFIDNDDFWKGNTALSEIASQLKESKADVLFFDSTTYWENREEYIESSSTCKRTEIISRPVDEALEILVKKQLLYRAVWTKVVKTSLIKEHNILFPEGMRNEDTAWTAHLLIYMQTCDYYEKKFHVYRKGTGHAQTDKKPTYKIVADLAEICEKYIAMGEKIDPARKKVLYHYLAYPYSVWMAQVQMLERKQRKKQVATMKHRAYILNYNWDPSVKIVSISYKVSGFQITSKLLKLYMTKKYRTMQLF